MDSELLPSASVRHFPHAPGVYLMKDAADRVIYVGKAKDLRSRAGSYFQKAASEDPRTAPLIPEIARCDYLVTESEVEAILLEAKLIKELQPKFNRSLKDDKSFPYLQINIREPFPRVSITRNPKTRGVKLFGPFTRSASLRGALLLLQELFQFRTCTHAIRPDDPRWQWFRPCLLHSVKRCSAPCNLRVSVDDYRLQIKRLIKFLNGKRSSLLRQIKQEMITAAAARQYEKAATLRDQIRDLKRLGERGRLERNASQVTFQIDPRRGLRELQKVLQLEELPRMIEGVDIAHLSGTHTVGSVVSFIDGVPFKNGYRRYKIRSVDGVNDVASIAEVVSRRFSDATTTLPNILLVDGGLGQLHAACEALSHTPHNQNNQTVVISLAKKEEQIFRTDVSAPLVLPRRSPALKLLQYVRDEAHRFAQHYHHLLRSMPLHTKHHNTNARADAE